MEEVEIEGILEFSTPVHEDDRGFFKEIIRLSNVKNSFSNFDVRQINHSRSTKNTLRGIHVASWNKIVYVSRGKVQCVIVDCRKDSSTFGKYKSFILGDENRSSLFVPAGCGNSYLVLSEEADYIYFIDREWEPGQEVEVKWDDPELNIGWEIKENLSLSQRDLNAKSFSEAFSENK